MPGLCSKCLPSTSTQALRWYCHWSMASSTASCSSPHHTTITRCRSLLMSWTMVWYTRCCMTDQMALSTGLRSNELGLEQWTLEYCWGTFLLEIEHVSRNTSYYRQKFLQQNIPVMDCTGLVLPHSWGSKAKASDTFTRHAVLSCAVLTHSASGSSVQSLMSSVQRLRGLPLFLVPAIRQWRMEVQRLSALITCAMYRSFLRCMSFSSRPSVSSSSRMDWIVLRSFQLILNIILYAVISNLLFSCH